MKKLRDIIFLLNLEIGVICQAMLIYESYIPNNLEPYPMIDSQHRNKLSIAVSKIMQYLFDISVQLHIDLFEAITCKIELNKKKYDVTLCTV